MRNTNTATPRPPASSPSLDFEPTSIASCIEVAEMLDFVIFAFTAVFGLVLILIFFWFSSTPKKSAKVMQGNFVQTLIVLDHVGSKPRVTERYL